MRIALNRLTAILLSAALSLSAASGEREKAERPDNAILSIEAARCPNNPLITFESSASLGENVNGPSVIRVPSWIENPLGKYYMYFAHHGGKYIRLAYADALEGPWKIHEPGTLRLEQAKSFTGHIASPDVHIDGERKEIRMYFHGPTPNGGGQRTGVAFSKNGLDFSASGDILGHFYFRVFRWNDCYYSIAKEGNSGWGMLYRSKEGVTHFEPRGQFVEKIRHCAVLLKGDTLIVFHTRAGDAPERIVAITVDISDDWTKWIESEPIEVLRPEKDYEGIEYPIKPSTYGSAIRVQQLRDPCIFEEDGKTYLFYSVAGEMGIAMAELKITMKE